MKKKNYILPTKCIVHSGLVVVLSSIAIIEHRQIYDLTVFKGCKFGSLGNLNIIAFKSATKPYISRWQALNEKKTHRRNE